MELYWVWLSTLKFVGPVLQKRLLDIFGNPKSIFDACQSELVKVSNLNNRALESITLNKSLNEAEKILSSAIRNNIKLLVRGDSLYPPFASNCPESPALLYYRGDLKPCPNSVAVIGSRRCTSYGKKMALEIGMELASKDIPVISGFAKGVDSYAQAACIRQGGYTIGFLANGVDICYPKEQRGLVDQILDSGGVFISQYPPGTQPNFKYFLQRNALISAWSREVIIVEATEKSGALWTVQFAKKYSRKIYAVPNQLGIGEGLGTNGLIASGDATPFLGVGSLESVRKRINSFDIEKVSINPDNHQNGNPLLSFLIPSPKTILEISSKFQKTEQSILEELLTLELEGEITIRGNMVSLK